MELLPHALPYFLFVGIGSLGGVLGPWTEPVRVLAVLVALAIYLRRGAYPELAVRPCAAQSLAGVAAGLAVGVAWVPLSTIVPLSPLASERTGMPPDANVALLACRLAGMVLLVPFAEELLVRSAVPRFVAGLSDADWRVRPVGVFTPMAAAVSLAFFTVSHPEWLAALATGIVWTLLLMATRNVRVVVLSHAVANAWLAGYVLVTGETQWW